MQVVTLITTPTERNLDAALVDSLRNAWGGGDATWLAVDEAAEFAIPVAPDNQWDVWADLQNACVDLVIQPLEGRRKKMLLADMDSTMIRQECVDELAEEAGVGEAVSAITKRAMNGELDFEGALIERVGLLKGLAEDTIAKVLSTRITPMPGGATLVATMKANGARAVLVSGGFVSFTSVIAERLGFDEHRANTLLAENGVLTGDVARPILGRDAKVQALDEISARLGLTAEDVLAIGDGANDLGMIERAGTGVAVHAKPSVQAAARHRINHGDLTAILYLQGYSRDTFVTV